MEKELSVYMKPFVVLAGLLLRLVDRKKWNKHISFRAAKELRVVYPDMEQKQAERMFRERRLAYVLLVVFLGMGAVTAAVFGSSDGVKMQEGGIVRNDYTKDARQISLQVDYESGRSEQVELIVAAREYTREEVETMLADFCGELPDFILGENTSLDRIRENLLLKERYEGYPFTVSWYCPAGNYMSDTGELLELPTLPVQTCLEPVIMYGDMQWEEVIYITILPGEVQKEGLKDYLTASEAESREDLLWVLPEEWQGEKLRYRVVQENDWGIGLLFVAAVMAAVFFLAERDLHEHYEQRQKRLKAEYPELLHRIVLYMGAGMTIRGSLQQINAEYVRKRAAGYGEVIAFEELGYVCREIHTGVSEAEAYQRFGQRTGLQEYVQLSTLLTQNLQKGSNALMERLREEAQNAQTEYLRHCKKAGEEAETKLLLPMVMMLVVVMLMILVPAFHSAGI